LRRSGGCGPRRRRIFRADGIAGVTIDDQLTEPPGIHGGNIAGPQECGCAIVDGADFNGSLRHLHGRTRFSDCDRERGPLHNGRKEVRLYSEMRSGFLLDPKNGGAEILDHLNDAACFQLRQPQLGLG
jgi:hypothetical protein